MGVQKKKILSTILVFILVIGNVKYPILANEILYDSHTHEFGTHEHLPGVVCDDHHEHSSDRDIDHSNENTGFCDALIAKQTDSPHSLTGSFSIEVDESLLGNFDINSDLDDEHSENIEEDVNISDIDADEQKESDELEENEEAIDSPDETENDIENTDEEMADDISYIKTYQIIRGQNRELSNEISSLEIDYLTGYLDNKTVEEVEYSKILFDFDNNPSYLLTVYSPGGYAIMHRDSLTVMEYSDTAAPLKDFYDVDLYYAGPLAYYYMSNNEFVSVKSGEVVPFEDVHYFIDIADEFTNGLTSCDFEIVEYDAYEDDFILDNITARAPSKIVDIPHVQDFKKLEFGRNSTGICGSVATEIILRYYHKFVNTAFMDSSHFNNNGLVDNDSFIVPFVNDYRIREGDFTKGTYPAMDAFNLNYYLGDDIRRQSTGYQATSIFLTSLDFDLIDQEIDNGNPVAIYLFGHSKYHEHVVVAYGYKVDMGLTFYRIHSGWYSDCEDPNNKNVYNELHDIYILGGFPGVTGAMWLEPTSAHTHDFDTVYDTETAKPGFHFSKCKDCDLVSASAHNFKAYANEFSHSRRCTVCDIETDLCIPGVGELTITDAGSTHIIDCLKCGLNVQETHVFSYTSLTGNEHLVQCNMCGKSHAEDHRLIYPQTTASGHTAKCISCNYSADKSHTYSNWGSDNSSQHSRTCTECKYKQSESHSFGPYSYNTSTHSRACNKCNYVEQFNHTLSSWSSNGVFMLNKSELDSIEDIYTEDYTYTEPYEINLPNYDEINIDYIISENADGTEDLCITPHGISSYAISGHSRNCTVCSYIETAEHSYQLQDSNSLQHKSVCTVCNSTIYEYHSFGKWVSNGSSGHKRTCACGRTETQNHNMSKYSFLVGSTHTVSCTECDYSISENHTLSSYSASPTSHSRTCTKCAYSETQNHSYGSYSSNGTLQHQRKCTICNYTENSSHSMSSWGSKNNDYNYHYRSCSSCGYSESQSHSWGSWTSSGSSNHQRSCMTCRITQTGSHSMPSWSSNMNQHSRNCTICQHYEYGSHSYSGWSSSTSQHERKCNTCGYSDKASHSYSSWSSSSFGNTHERTCSVCRYVQKESHNMPFSWSSASSYHYKDCTVCRYRQQENHMFLFDNCMTCGYKK